MSRKMYALLLPVLAIVAMAMTAGSAQAAFHWYKCAAVKAGEGKFSNNACTAEGEKHEFELKRLPFSEAEKLQVISFGKLKLTLASGVSITCKVSDAGNIWNVALAEPGKDEVTSFVTYECVASPAEDCPEPEIIAKGLPWKTELGENAAKEPIVKIKGIKVTLFCSKVEVTTFEGELSPTLTNPTVSEPLVLTFTAATGTLENAAKEKAKVEGADRIVGFEHGEGIFVKNP
jgi:hypothetical protein